MAADDVINDAKGRLEALVAPINGGPGADVSYDELFDRAKTEVDKLTSLSGGKVDWGLVTSSCEDILTDKGKDFRVALYYATARGMTSGLEGLLDGLVLLQELIAGFWTTMGPPLKRPKARGSLCSWYSDLVAPVYATYQPTLKDADLVAAIEQVSRGVDGDLADKLGDAYAGMNALRSLIKNLTLSVPKPPPPPPPPPPKPVAVVVEAPPVVEVVSQVVAAPVAVVTGGGFSADSITSTEEALNAVPECGRALARVGALYRGADVTDASAYQLGRAGLWLEILQAPPAEEGVTRIPSPPTDAKASLEALAASEDWAGLIEAAEALAAESPLWLDPQRFVALALEKLGAEDARRSLVRAVGYLLARAEGLHTFQFDDGTPLADDETRAFIEDEVLKSMGSGGGGGGGAPRASGNPLDKAITEARALAATGELAPAVTAITKALAAVTKPVDRFRGRLAVAKLCLDGGQGAVARAQLEALERVAERHHLDEWEPALAAEFYGALYLAYRVTAQGEELTPEARARFTMAFERLCSLDGAAAIALMAG